MTALGCALVGLVVGVALSALAARLTGRPTEGPRARVEAVLVPAATAALFGAVAARLGRDWAVPAFLVFAAALVVVTLVDVRVHLVPNRVVYPAGVASLALLAVAAAAQGEWSRLGRALAAAALAWLALLVLHLASPGSLGFGDVRLACLVGLHLGWLSYGHVVVGIGSAVMLAAGVATALVLRGARSLGDRLPLAPFLAAGAVVALVAGEPILRAWPS